MNDIFSEREKRILKYIDNKYNYIVRDESGDLYLFEDKPFKHEIIWLSKSDYGRKMDDSYNDLFESIKWTNKEPFNFRNYIQAPLFYDDFSELVEFINNIKVLPTKDASDIVAIQVLNAINEKIIEIKSRRQ